jgi:hypothetical protein
MFGCDIWSGAYKAVFTKKRCEENAVAEGVSNVRFVEGNAVRLPFPDESFDAVTSNYVYHNIAGQNKQALLLETIESEQATPSLSQAQRIKKLSQSGDLNEDSILGIMAEQKKPELSSNITLSGDKLKKYFPKSYTPAQIENTIFKLLDSWLRKRQREESR